MCPSTMPTTGSDGDLRMSPGFIADSEGLVASTGFGSASLVSAGLASTGLDRGAAGWPCAQAVPDSSRQTAASAMPGGPGFAT